MFRAFALGLLAILFLDGPGTLFGADMRDLSVLGHEVRCPQPYGDERTLWAEGALTVPPVGKPAGVSMPDVSSETGIRFDLDRLNADGLQGPPDGLRALHYEYCIPDHPDAIREVSAIDPTLEIQGGSPGRVGCGEGELLCLGHTYQPNHRAVLELLAALPMVAEIHEAVFE
jgi:hypothetical protein